MGPTEMIRDWGCQSPNSRCNPQVTRYTPQTARRPAVSYKIFNREGASEQDLAVPLRLQHHKDPSLSKALAPWLCGLRQLCLLSEVQFPQGKMETEHIPHRAVTDLK